MMRATPIVVALLVASAASSVAARGSGSRGFLSLKADMQPEVVARTLMDVEDAWRKEAASAVDSNSTGNTDESDARTRFEKSCNTIVTAVVQASSGNRATVTEYMGDVCGVRDISGWRQEQCHSLASAITDTMSADGPSNRDQFDSSALCHAYWSSFLMEEGTRLKEERAQEAVAEKQRQEAEQKAAEEERKRQEAEQKAAEERAEEAAKEEAAKEEAATQEAAELEAKRAEAQNSTAPEAMVNRTAASTNSSTTGASVASQNSSQNTTELNVADSNTTKAKVTPVLPQNISSAEVTLANTSAEKTPVNSSKVSTVHSVMIHNVSEAVVQKVTVVGANVTTGQEKDAEKV